MTVYAFPMRPGRRSGLLVMPEAEKRWRRRDEDEEPVEDSYDRFISRGQLPY